MKQIAVLLAEGFEETEAVAMIDFFRRLEQRVETLACGQTGLEVLGYHEMALRADVPLSFRSRRLYDAVVLPGGPSGARRLGGDAMVVEFVKAHLAAGRLVCPFCSAGAHVMAANRLLGARQYTCSGDNHALYDDGEYVDAVVVRSDTVLSGKGLGVVFEFAEAISAALGLGEAGRNELRHIYFNRYVG